MRATLLRAGMVAGILALCGPSIPLAQDSTKPADPAAPAAPAEPGKPAKEGKPASKAGKRNAYGKGQNWDAFAKKFDANADGKVSKEEFLAKRPAFDHIDGNHDGSVTADEVKAMPAVAKRGGSGQNFVARFDADKDGKVTTAEYDAKRTTLFEKIDKNKDGAIEQSELKGQAAGEEVD